MSTCTYSRIKIGTHVSNSRNWNLNCPLHGTESEWFNSAEQVEARNQASQRLRLLFAEARAARESIDHP